MAMIELGSTMRVMRPYPHIWAFYDGRVPGERAWSAAPNWLDDGAFALGICSYAIVDGAEALVYDSHISLAHAGLIRSHLERAGVTSIRLVLSHWHDDHVAGNAVFADCDIIATRRTYAALERNREKLETGDPPIHPLVMPTRLFEGGLSLVVGTIPVELRHAEIHSDDAALLLLPDDGILLAGDTLEDSVTYVAEPSRLAVHLAELGRIETWDIFKILPNHGRPEVIAAGGYDKSLFKATRRYTEKLLRVRAAPGLAALGLEEFAAESFATGGAVYFAPYEAVHEQNIKAVLV